MEENIVILRTVNNQMVIGENTLLDDERIVLSDPFALVPVKEGIRLYPFDLELIGKAIGSVKFDTHNVLYVADPSDTLKDEYIRLKNGEVNEQEPTTEPAGDLEEPETQQK
jgi:hypothetical protein